MTRLRIFLLTAGCMLATGPWLFTAHRNTHIAGFPPWAFYTFCATAAYPFLVAVLIGKYWRLMAGDEQADGD